MSLYKNNRANHDDIANNFKGCAFNPPLESYVDDVDGYIEKILKNAERFECWVDDELAGLLAIYCNDNETRTAFITMVSVMTKYTKMGIATTLLNQAIEYSRNKGFKKVRLEVMNDNLKAIKVYNKFGFTEQDTREKFVIMELGL